VKNYTFNWEVQTLVEQFIGAFNDVIIKRYDENETLVEPVTGDKVLFVYSPKQRVFSNLNSPAAGGLTVPVIAVNIGSISRDQARVFNKIDGFTIDYDPKDGSGNFLKHIPQPVPVNITIDMTIITRYQADMDQILTNFVPYTDPYIIISWKLPSNHKSNTPYEIRSEVLWSGNINMQYPDNLGATQPYRITATTQFTIKGWMFKSMDEVYKKIYTIDSKFLTTDGKTLEDSTQSSTPPLLRSFSDFSQGLGLTVGQVSPSIPVISEHIYMSSTGDFSIVPTSGNNTASGTYSNVLGGKNNTASGNYAGILGGENNTATNNNSFVIGSNIVTSQDNTTYVNNLNADNVTANYLYGDGSHLTNISTGGGNLAYDATSGQLSLGANNTTSLAPLIYSDVVAPSSYQTIQQFTQYNTQQLQKGYDVVLTNGRVYKFAGNDRTNPNHFLPLNLNPHTPIFVQIQLSGNNTQTLVDKFHLSDFKTAKYTLQVETNYSNDIYYSEINVVASLIDNMAVVSEYGQITTGAILINYNATIDSNYVYFWINYFNSINNTDFIFIKGLRTNHFLI
jgi:hypothetical protein